MTAKRFGHLLTRYFFFAWVEQILVYRKWANRLQWRRACIKGFAVLLAVVGGVILYWMGAFSKSIVTSNALPFFFLFLFNSCVLLNIFFIGIFKFDGIFAVPDRIGLLHSNEPLSFTEVADPTPEKFVLGDRGKTNGGYWWVDWNSTIFEQQFEIIGSENYRRRWLKNWFLFCAFAEPNTIAFLMDAGQASGEEFKDFTGKTIDDMVGGVIVLEEPHQIKKATNWILKEFNERAKKRLNGVDKKRRIVVFIDDVLSSLVYEPEREDVSDSLRDFGYKMRAIIANGVGHNVRVVMCSPPSQLPYKLPPEISPKVLQIVFPYQIFGVNSEGKPGILRSPHPAFADVVALYHQQQHYVMKVPLVDAKIARNEIDKQFGKADAETHEIFLGLIDSLDVREYVKREKRKIIVGGEEVKATEWQKAEAA